MKNQNQNTGSRIVGLAVSLSEANRIACRLRRIVESDVEDASALAEAIDEIREIVESGAEDYDTISIALGPLICIAERSVNGEHGLSAEASDAVSLAGGDLLEAAETGADSYTIAAAANKVIEIAENGATSLSAENAGAALMAVGVALGMLNAAERLITLR